LLQILYGIIFCRKNGANDKIKTPDIGSDAILIRNKTRSTIA
jgi:hypothetical protein